MSRCEDCVTCSECPRIAYCLSEPNPLPPCPHDLPLCGECNLADCPECRMDAEREMFRTGIYDPRADPFFRHDVPEPVDAIARDGGYWWDGSWVARP